MTLIFGTLYLLASVDAALSGYAAAAGRNALIEKGAYYKKAMLRGFVLGQIAAALGLSAVLLVLNGSSHPASLRADLHRLGIGILQVYLPFTAVLLAAFAVRSFPSAEVRSFTSGLAYGPLAGLRPLVGVAGLAWGLASAPRPEFAAGGALILAAWLSFERILGFAYRVRAL